MKEITTNLITHAVFSAEEDKRYLLTKTWDSEKPRLTVIMLAPSEASGIELDNTTMLVLNNASRLGYGAVNIVNLFATLGDCRWGDSVDADAENMTMIDQAAQDADMIVYAPGVGKAGNKAFIERQNRVLDVLRPYETKMRCLSNNAGEARFQHPLSPAVRVWYLSPMKISELYQGEPPAEKKEVKGGKKSMREKK
jgi:hypothetical protein